jgi:hypothetical protein
MRAQAWASVAESDVSLQRGAQVAAVISSPNLGVLAVAAAGVLCAFCCLVDALPGQCLRRKPRAYPLVAAVFRTNGYCMNAVQLHVYAADLLVRPGMDRDGSR